MGGLQDELAVGVGGLVDVPQHGEVRVGAGLGFHRAVEGDGTVLHQRDAPLRLAHLQLGHCEGGMEKDEERWVINIEKSPGLGRMRESSPSCRHGCSCLGPACTGPLRQRRLHVLLPNLLSSFTPCSTPGSSYCFPQQEAAFSQFIL